jgi:DNA-binding PadR family transcriptional regulator
MFHHHPHDHHQHHHAHRKMRGFRHGMGHRHFGGGGPRGRQRRRFEGAELKLVLLKLIEDQPRHGYDLIREIEDRSGGAYAPSPGLVYPTLTLLTEMGLIEEAGGDGGRKQFQVTEAGRAHLAEHAAEVETAFERLRQMAEVSGRTDAAPIVRAMHNLQAAIHNRLSQEGVGKTTVLDVAALIDQAASGIERL